jgi:hypothetical protein
MGPQKSALAWNRRSGAATPAGCISFAMNHSARPGAASDRLRFAAAQAGQT